MNTNTLGYYSGRHYTEYEKQFIYLLNLLPDDEKKRILELLEFEVSRQKNGKKIKSREKPPAQVLLKGQ